MASRYYQSTNATFPASTSTWSKEAGLYKDGCRNRQDKGLGAVVTGIVPKMAIRFTSFEAYKKLLADKETGNVSGQATFLGKYPKTSCSC